MLKYTYTTFINVPVKTNFSYPLQVFELKVYQMDVTNVYIC